MLEVLELVAEYRANRAVALTVIPPQMSVWLDNHGIPLDNQLAALVLKAFTTDCLFVLESSLFSSCCGNVLVLRGGGRA
jgi:hypothetical protein